MNRSHRFAVMSSALALTAVIGSPALAQEAEVAVEQAAPAAAADSGEIIVTAQKRAERLLDVPLAVTAVTGDTLADRQINDTNSLVQAVPSLTFQQGANPTNTSFRIRGIGTSLFGQGTESSVSTVVDGVVAVRQAQSFSDLADIERVEVLRGPQGTLFGKNASAGVISVTTARPSREFTASGELTVAEHDEYRVRGTVSGPLSDTLRARITGYYNDVRGITRNVGRNRWVNGTQGFGIRGKLEWDATENLNFLLSAEYRETNSDCCASTLIRIDNPVLRSVVGPAVVPSRTNRVINEDTDTYANTEAQTYSLQADWDLGPATVTSITALQKYHLDVNQPIDRINAPAPLFLGAAAAYTWWNQNHGVADIEGFSQELRIANNGGGDFNYVAGVFYMHSYPLLFTTLGFRPALGICCRWRCCADDRRRWRLFHRIRIDGLFGSKGWARSSAALPHGLRRRRLEPENEGAEQIGIRTGRSEGNADAASTFYDARSDLEQPQAQGCKLGACQSSGPGHRLLDAP